MTNDKQYKTIRLEALYMNYLTAKTRSFSKKYIVCLL